MNQIVRLAVLLFIGCLATLPNETLAQVESPNRKFVFDEDADNFKDNRAAEIEKRMEVDTASDDVIDFQAREVEYLQDGGKMRGTGGVVVSSRGMQIQADRGVYDVNQKVADLEGNVIVTAPETVIEGDTSLFNLESETGEFDRAHFTLEDGGYDVEGERVFKLSEDKYRLLDSGLTTCHCEDESKPWCIYSDKANITEEGYAHTYGTYMKMWDTVPLFYTPWMAFPVKRERASGLLAPTYGYGSEDGVMFKLPLFVVLDDYTDAMFTPFTETKTRHGNTFDFRKAFSKYNSLDTRITYSNESARGDSLRGTNVDGVEDARFDKHRFGGYLSHNWRSSPDSDLKLNWVSDIHLVSDDLFLREMNDEDIGKRSARYTVSTSVFRSSLGDYGYAELLGEYNQSMLTDDDLVQQRLPELTVGGSKSFRPFGFNPYGFKVVAGGTAVGTRFSRREGFDGTRLDLNPRLKIPMHYKNYVNTDLELGVNQTYYEMDETFDPSSGLDIESSQDRTVFRLDYKVATAVERVYDLPEENVLTTVTGLGERNQTHRLSRVRHTIEPWVNFGYVPDTTQDDLPLYDSLDRIRERSLFTYGFQTSLFGKFSPLNEAIEEISELAPRIKDLPTVDTERGLSPFGEEEVFGGVEGAVPLKKSNIRELARFTIKQSYDYVEDKENNDPLLSPWSDVGIDLGFFPSWYFGFGFDTNYDAEEQEVSSWSMATHVKDDRGDLLRARYTYIDDSVSQLEANLQVKIIDRLKLGAYGLFDEEENEFIENRFALRLESACNCWHFDSGFTQEINPDKEHVFFTFTFKGLGDISQDAQTYDEND